MAEPDGDTPLSVDLEPGETLRASFMPDRSTYLRDHAWMAALAMALGMAILWLIGNPHVWTGAVGGLAAIAIRGSYLASEELGHAWHLTDRRLVGPGGRSVPLSSVARVRTLGSAVQVITKGGDKHLLKYQPDRDATRARIEGAQP